jgi:ubiquinone biosynthesis protein COQ9
MQDQAAFLSRILEEVPFTGWNTASFKAAETVQGEGFLLFPQGIEEVLAFWQAHLNAGLQPSGRTKMREKIEDLIVARITAAPVEAVRRALAWYITHPSDGAQTLWQAVDSIWHLAGDTATDWNYYTKRTLLAGIYQAALFYWLNNTDEAALRAFTSRRIEGLLKVMQKKSRV